MEGGACAEQKNSEDSFWQDVRNNLGVSQKHLGAKEIFTWGMISVMQSRIDVTKMFVITNLFIYSFKQSTIPTSDYWAPMYVVGAIRGTADAVGRMIAMVPSIMNLKVFICMPRL